MVSSQWTDSCWRSRSSWHPRKSSYAQDATLLDIRRRNARKRQTNAVDVEQIERQANTNTVISNVTTVVVNTLRRTIAVRRLRISEGSSSQSWGEDRIFYQQMSNYSFRWNLEGAVVMLSPAQGQTQKASYELVHGGSVNAMTTNGRCSNQHR